MGPHQPWAGVARHRYAAGRGTYVMSAGCIIVIVIIAAFALAFMNTPKK